MLETLRIRNIAVIETAEVQFKKGLNILSGETGAGKSIVIESISLILGERASIDLIRTGCEEASVEGLFDLGSVPAAASNSSANTSLRTRLIENGIMTEADDMPAELLVKRSVNRNGKSRIHINGQVATLSMLQRVTEGLVDLCSQHEHQSLTKPGTQLSLLDRYGSHSVPFTAYTQKFTAWRALIDEKERLSTSESERLKRMDFLRYQLQELIDAALTDGEEASLSGERQLLQSAESRGTLAQSAADAIDGDSGDEPGALGALRLALTKLRALTQLEGESGLAHPITQAAERAVAEVEECSIALSRYVNAIEHDPARLEEVQDRLSLISDLKRKYGAEIAEIIALQNGLQSELASLEDHEASLEKINMQIAEAQSALEKAGRMLSSARAKTAKLLSDSVTGELKDLKMGDARFITELTPIKDVSAWTASGPDSIQFVVQTNAGEAPKPVGKIASGGELSRLMLAIRRVISDQGGIGVYLFDEIDAGISGQTAFQVGKKLRSVAKHHQVICITHLPQVAAFADSHWVVRKDAVGSGKTKRTQTVVENLGVTERREELARMLGGPELTKKSLENARELIELAH